jgi:ribosome maturation factor RimP
MIDKSLVAERAQQYLDESGSDSFLVDVAVKPGNYIVVEIDSVEGIDIEECVALSRFIEAGLDRDAEDFELEVGSAGITSPFKVLRQYEKNIGNQVEVLTRAGIKMSGVLTEADADGFVIVVTKLVKLEGAKRKTAVEENVRLAYDEVKYTKYKFQ